MTQKNVAESVGLLPKTISALENNPEKSSIESLYKYISALGCDIVLAPREMNNDADW